LAFHTGKTVVQIAAIKVAVDYLFDIRPPETVIFGKPVIIAFMDKLYLSDTDKKIGGVCGGLGEFFGKDATLFRILFILLILFSFGFGVIAYLAMWLVIPKRPPA